MLSFTGVRGIVSLAAALAIPFATDAGQPFPERATILFLTFAVIVVTLVGQGLLLPPVIRALGLAHAGRRERHADRMEENRARLHATQSAMARLDALIDERDLTRACVDPLRAQLEDRLHHIERRDDGDDSHRKINELRDEIEALLIATERDAINDLFREGKLKDEARRRIERELDLREAHLANQKGEE
jgi:CPA1 family monovalent cation:H+ antiporter